VWAEPFTPLRVPKLFDLRADPTSGPDVTSNTYWHWFLSKAYVIVDAQAGVARFLATFQEFPPSQRPATFTIDQPMKKLWQTIGN